MCSKETQRPGGLGAKGFPRAGGSALSSVEEGQVRRERQEKKLWDLATGVPL